ncbi:hypothetical protein [Flexithrix dorotheae]|uniref:hypothetical protein n=1 Tax=Flexithrix dorotheae TaxID=70993 RepID=UPI00036ECA64|nr:hypothetical protein [Flexithrix dorotheae]
MKITNKIIIGLASLIAVCVFTFLISLRMNMQSATAAEPAKFNKISVPAFHSIQIERDWNVEIVNGESIDVSLGEFIEDEKGNGSVVVENGVLIFKTSEDKDSRYRFPGKVTVKNLKSIKVKNAFVNMKGLSIDSLMLDVDDANSHFSNCNFSTIVMKNKNGRINCNDTKIEVAEVYFEEGGQSHFSAKKIIGEVNGNSSLGLFGAVDSLGVKFGESAKMYKH